MNESRSNGRLLPVMPLVFLFACALSTVADAQGVPEVPGRDTPPNDCGCSREDDTIPVSSGMLSPFLPKIPNLELGFLYYFGNRVSTGRFTADYLLPFRLSSSSVLFGEAHAEGWGFWKSPSVSVAAVPGFTATTDATNNRVDLSFGGGYRTMLGANAFFGVNGFYDASRLFDTWYSSGGLGLEFAANLAGDDAIDLNFNWYGNLFNRDVLVNAFRNKGNSLDLEAGYSHALFNQALDLRLKLAGYQFDVRDKVYGWRGGADLTTRDGVLTLRYEYGSDLLNGSYNTVGGFVNVGFQLENLLSGESPFTFPQPVFKSPRDLRRLLGLKVKRNWQQPTAVLLARATPSPPVCANLHGIVLIADIIPVNTDILIGQMPYVTTATATFCWCNLSNPTPRSIKLFVYDDYNRYQYDWFTLHTSTDCVTVNLQYTSSTRFNKLYIDSYPSENLEFGAGGGISIAFP